MQQSVPRKNRDISRRLAAFPLRSARRARSLRERDTSWRYVARARNPGSGIYTADSRRHALSRKAFLFFLSSKRSLSPSIRNLRSRQVDARSIPRQASLFSSLPLASLPFQGRTAEKKGQLSRWSRAVWESVLMHYCNFIPPRAGELRPGVPRR